MQPFAYHVIVCTQSKPDNTTCCHASGAGALVERLQGELRKQGAADDVILSTSGCLSACDHGPLMVVYPDAVWYGPVQPADIAEIVASHLKNGKVVERLRIADMAALRTEMLDHRKDFASRMMMRDKAGVVPDELKDMASGFMASRAFLTALELDVFTIVGEGASPTQVAAQCKTDARATEILLNALAGLGLLAKSDGVFSNSANAKRFLAASSPDNARDALVHNAHVWQRWSTLTECVRQGTSVVSKAGMHFDPKVFLAAMDRNAKERVMMVMRAIGNGFKRVLDLGGGSGAYSIAFAKANPELKADVIELPAMAPLTQEYIRKAGVEGRVCVRVGKLPGDLSGQDYDLVLLSLLAPSFSPDQNRDLLRRAYSVLAPNGRLVLQDFVLEPSKTSPRMATLASLCILTNTEAGQHYSEPEYDGWMREAGFRETKRVRLPGPVTLMIASK